MKFGYCNVLIFLLIGLFSVAGFKPNAILGQETAVNQSSDSKKKESRISLLTVSPGTGDVASIFGHSALRVKGVKGGEDILYNFGTYSWDQPNFLLNFLRGRLLYKVSKQYYGPFLNGYHAEQRSITEQTLQLTDQQEASILSALAKNYRAENREYLYEFFFDNCTTRLRDIISAGCEGDLDWAVSQDRYSFRDLLHQYTQSNAWLTFGIDLLVGSRTDQIANQQQEMFLPDYLMFHLDQATDGAGNPIVYSEHLVLDFQDKVEERKQKDTKWPLYLFGVFFLIEVFIFFKKYQNKSIHKVVIYWDRFWYFVLGLGGLVLLIMWVLTDHYTTKGNWNIMWLTPLYFGLLGRWKKSRILNYIIIASLILGGVLYAWSGQHGNIAFLPLIVMIILKIIRNLFQSELSTEANTQLADS